MAVSYFADVLRYVFLTQSVLNRSSNPGVHSCDHPNNGVLIGGAEFPKPNAESIGSRVVNHLATKR
jgi:hypothetical protein